MSYRLPWLMAALALGAASFVLCNRAAAQEQAPAVPQFPQANPPWEVMLTQEQQLRVEQIVKFWSFSSSKINTFECNFTRLDYTAFSPNPNVAATMATGVIRYARPDKGEYRVDNLQFYVPDSDPAQYQAQEGQVGEHWVCDGSSIYEFKPQQEVLLEMRLPPEMQGSAISNGPLPFLFGVEANKLFERYWIREIQPPPGQENVYWLEAYPKRAEDAANFSMAVIILDREDFLPSAMQLIMPGGNEKKTFQFTDRKKNAIVANFMQNWLNNFIKPDTPRGWRTVVEDFGSVPDAGQGPAQQLPAAPGGGAPAEGSIYEQAQRPQGTAWREE